MRVLLTGASGFVGINIAEALCRRGNAVVLFASDPLPEAARSVLDAAVGPHRFVLGDVRDAGALAAAASGCDAVIHGAAVTPAGPREAEAAVRTIEINVIGTLNALAAAQRAGVMRFVLLGSAAVYGAGATAAPRLEEDTTPALPETTYAITKFAAERLVLRFGRLEPHDVRCVRIGSVFGPWERDTGVRDTLSAIHQATMAALSGRPAVLPRPGPRDWIYARDVAAAVLAVLDAPTPPNGVINIGLGMEWTVEAWCRLLAARFPDFQYELAGPQAAPTIDFYGPFDRAPLAIDRLTREVGFRPSFGMEAAFADYLDWLDKQGRSPDERT